MPDPIRVSSGWVLVHDKSLHVNRRNSSCLYFRPPSSVAGWRPERAPGGGEALPVVWSTHLPGSSWSVCLDVGGKHAPSRQAPLGAKVSRNTPSPPTRRCGPWGVGSGDNFGESRGPRPGGPRSGGGRAGRTGLGPQFSRRPRGGAGAADQVTERRSRLREAASFSAAAAAATPSGEAGKGGPGVGGVLGRRAPRVEAEGRRAEASAAAAVSRRGWAHGMGAPR